MCIHHFESLVVEAFVGLEVAFRFNGILKNYTEPMLILFLHLKIYFDILLLNKSLLLNIWNAVVYFQPPSLLIGQVWVPVMHFCTCTIPCRVHWRVGRRPGSCRWISVQPLIGSTILVFSIALLCGYWRFCLVYIDTVSVNPITASYGGWLSGKLVNVVSGVPQGSVWGPLLSLLYTSELFSILENNLIGYADDSTLMAVVLSPGIRVTVAESLIRDLGSVSEWCEVWRMKLNSSKTKTMIVSRSRTMHPQSPSLTIGGTVLKESDAFVNLEVTFDSKMTFEKHLRSVSRAASQRLCILRKSLGVFHDRSLLGRCFGGFVLPVLEYCSAIWCSAADTHLKLLDRTVSGARFLTGVCLIVTLLIADPWQSCVCIIRSGVTLAPS